MSSREKTDYQKQLRLFEVLRANGDKSLVGKIRSILMLWLNTFARFWILIMADIRLKS